MNGLRTVWRLARTTFAEWGTDDGWLYAAAMAAFAALALAPLLVITLRVAETFGGEAPVAHALALIVDPIVGHGGVRVLDDVAGHGRAPAGNGVLATILACLIAMFSGTRLFYALQRALHAMWDTPMHRGGSLATTLAAFLAAGVLSACVVAGMTAVIFGTAVFAAAASELGFRGVAASIGVRLGVAVVGALVLAPVVAVLFRWLPGAALTWGDVWIGALTTAAGFALAQVGIGIYLAYVNLPWTYGSAASLIVILLWLYYSSYLFLLGAEFTQVYAREMGSLRPVPADGPFGEKGDHA